MIKFWHKLSIDNQGKVSSCMLKTLKECFDFNIFKSEWLLNIKNTLDNCGLSFVWLYPTSVTTEWLYKKVNTLLKDNFIQYWSQKCEDCNKSCHYSLFKPTFGLEKYLVNLPFCYRVALTKIRTANHKLPIEKGRYRNIPREERKCTLCNLDKVGDEFHFILECPILNELRLKYIPQFYFRRPNFYKYSQLLSIQSKNKLLNLGKFLKEGLTYFK